MSNISSPFSIESLKTSYYAHISEVLKRLICAYDTDERIKESALNHMPSLVRCHISKLNFNNFFGDTKKPTSTIALKILSDISSDLSAKYRLNIDEQMIWTNYHKKFFNERYTSNNRANGQSYLPDTGINVDYGYLIQSRWNRSFPFSKIKKYSETYVTIDEKIDNVLNEFRHEFPSLSYLLNSDVRYLLNLNTPIEQYDVDKLCSRVTELGFDTSNKALWKLVLDYVVGRVIKAIGEKNQTEYSPHEEPVLNRWVRSMIRFPIRDDIIILLARVTDKLLRAGNIENREALADMRDTILYNTLFTLSMKFMFDIVYAAYSNVNGKLVLYCGENMGANMTHGDIVNLANNASGMDGMAYELDGKNTNPMELVYIVYSGSFIIFIKFDANSIVVSGMSDIEKRIYADKFVRSYLEQSGYTVSKNSHLKCDEFCDYLQYSSEAMSSDAIN